MRARTRSMSASISCLVASKPSSSRKRRSNTARQMSATHGVWMPSTGWPPKMPLMLSVACRAPGGTTGTSVRRVGEHRQQLVANLLQQLAHAVDGADAEERHAAVRDVAVGGHLEPVDAAVPDAHPIDVQRLGDDAVVGPGRRQAPVLARARRPRRSRRSPRPPCRSPRSCQAPARRRGGWLRPRRLRPRSRPSCRTSLGRRSCRRGPRRRTDRASIPRRPGRRRSAR